MNKFKNTYITLKDSDKTVERIKEIAEKYSKASGCELEYYLKEYGRESDTDWDYLAVTNSGRVVIVTSSYIIGAGEQITEQDLDKCLAAMPTLQFCGESPKIDGSPDYPAWQPLLMKGVGVEDGLECTSKVSVEDSAQQTSPETIGSLAEKLYMMLPPSNITISVNGDGHILIHGDKIPTVDATKLEAEDITKAYEALVMLEGLFVEGE